WDKVASSEEDASLSMVAQRHLRALARIDEEEKRLQNFHLELRNRRKEPEIADELEQQAFLAWRQEKRGDLAGAQRRYNRLRDEARKRVDDLQETGNRDVASADWQHRLADARFWQLSAASKSKQLGDSLAEKGQDDKARVTLISELVQKAEKSFTADAVWSDLWLIAQD